MSPARLWCPALAAALLGSVVVGCGGSSGSSAGTKPGQPIAKIVVLAPLSGALASQGAGIRNAVDLAVRQANQRGTVAGWHLEMVAEDDGATPDIGAEAASTVSSDPSVVGVVGPLNSGVAQEVVPVLDWAGLVVVSPSNTNDTLTKGPDFSSQPVRPHSNYFRIATTDSLQGQFGADYAFHTVGARRVVIIHDKKTYGSGIAQIFADRFAQDGGSVALVQEINAGDKDFVGVLTNVATTHPDLIFYGGEFPEAALLSKQAKEIGLQVPLMGGDGIKDDTFIRIAGQASEGDLATLVGAPAENLASARSFIDAYRAAGYPDGYSTFGVSAFDAANAIISASARVLPGRSALDGRLRRAVIDQLGRVDLSGATGRVTFDQYGDNVTKLLTVFKITHGEFVAEQTQAFVP